MTDWSPRYLDTSRNDTWYVPRRILFNLISLFTMEKVSEGWIWDVISVFYWSPPISAPKKIRENCQHQPMRRGGLFPLTNWRPSKSFLEHKSLWCSLPRMLVMVLFVDWHLDILLTLITVHLPNLPVIPQDFKGRHDEK